MQMYTKYNSTNEVATKYFYLCTSIQIEEMEKSKLVHLWTFVKKYKYFKYLFTVVVFLLIIGILDENSWVRRIQHQKEIRDLKSQIEKYQKQYDESNATLKALSSNPKELEKIARERYFMKEANEDIYVFEDDLKEAQEENPKNEESK